MNHGKGSKQAAINTHDHYQLILETWDIEKVMLPSFQLNLLQGEKS
jgi:hypothetical protein